MKALGIIWNTVFDKKDDIVSYISSKAKVYSSYEIHLDDIRLADFIHELYSYPKNEKWKENIKINDLLQFPTKSILAVEMDINVSTKVLYQEKNKYYFKELLEIKTYIRNPNSFCIDTYKENLFHLTDNEKEYWDQIPIVRKYYSLNELSFDQYVDSKADAKSYDLLPNYSMNAFDFILENFSINKNSTFVDIGCGTGRVTLELLKLGNTVFGVDPCISMLSLCDEKCKKYSSYYGICGTDHKTNLLVDNADCIIVAQAFHKFNTIAFKKETQRILSDDRNVVFMWNRFDYINPIYNETILAIKKYYPQLQLRYEDIVSGAENERQANIRQVAEFFDGRYKIFEFPEKIFIDYNAFLDLFMSLHALPIKNSFNSFTNIIKNGHYHDSLCLEMGTIFDTYQKDGIIVLNYKTEIIVKS